MPRYLLIVFAFAGDSTTTTFIAVPRAVTRDSDGKRGSADRQPRPSRRRLSGRAEPEVKFWAGSGRPPTSASQRIILGVMAHHWRMHRRALPHHRRAISPPGSATFCLGTAGRSCPHEPLRALPAPATAPIAVASAWPPRARSTRTATCSGSRACRRCDITALLDLADEAGRGQPAGREEEVDASRPHPDQPVLRAFDPHAILVRARRQAARRRRHEHVGRVLLGEEGRDADRHGDDAQRHAARHPRRAPPRGRRRASAGAARSTARSSTPATARTSIRPRRCSTRSPSAATRAASRA